MAQRVRRLPIMRETRVRSLGREDPLEKGMATHSSTLAWKIPWTEKPGWLLLPGKSHGLRSLVGYSPWGRKESDTTERLHFHFPWCSVGTESACNAGNAGSIPGWGRAPEEGNGNPLQYSCLENPIDRGAWRATVHGVAKSRTQLND